METKLIYGSWDEHARYVEIHIEGRRFVTVGQSISLHDFKPEKVMVNWSAIGSVSPSAARKAAAAIMEAAKVAEEMERVEEWGRITPPAAGLKWEGPGMPEIHIRDGHAWVSTDGWVEQDG